jgi:hypothetical protein
LSLYIFIKYSKNRTRGSCLGIFQSLRESISKTLYRFYILPCKIIGAMRYNLLILINNKDAK